MTFSIASRSSGFGSDMAGLKTLVFENHVGRRQGSEELLGEVGVLCRVEQCAGLGRVATLSDDHPAAVRILVDDFRLVLERGVDLDYFAGQPANTAPKPP